MSTIIEHLAHGERVTHVVRWTPDELYATAEVWEASETWDASDPPVSKGRIEVIDCNDTYDCVPVEQAKHPCLSIEFRWTGEMTVTLKDGQFEVDSEQDIAKLCTVLTVIYRRARQHIQEG